MQLYQIKITAKVEGRTILVVSGRIHVKQNARDSYSCEVSGPDHLVIGLSSTEEGAVVEVMQMLIPIAADALAAGDRNFPAIEGIEWIPVTSGLSLPPTAASDLLAVPEWDKRHEAVPV
ncbi:MAG: hypothetical protein OXJ90_08780 [Spirochaetaceae bacterium]|nr:hypothetical protein [Spirochaetaceae bacterium]